MRAIWTCIRASLTIWHEENCAFLAAALAFYVMFSFVPALLLIIVVAGRLFGVTTVVRELIDVAGDLGGSVGVRAMRILAESLREQEISASATVLSILVLLFSASRVFHQLHYALNRVWGSGPEAKPDVQTRVLRRVSAMATLLGVSLVLLVSLALDATFVGLSKAAIPPLPDQLRVLLLRGFNLLLSGSIVALTSAVLYKTLPDLRLQWRAAWIGALVNVVLFTLGRLFVGIYLGESSLRSASGIGGAIISILIWIYYSTQVFILGAVASRVIEQTR